MAAVNFDPAESDLASLDPEELAGAVTPAGRGARRGRRAAADHEEHERRQALWRYLLVGGAPAARGGDGAVQPAVRRRRPRARSRSELTVHGSRGSQTADDELRAHVIRGVRRRWRLRSALRGRRASCSAAALVTFAVSAFAMDHFRYEPWARHQLPPLRLRRAPRRWPCASWSCRCGAASRDERVALYLEEHEPSLQAAVLSAVEVGRAQRAARPHVSPALVAAAGGDGDREVPDHRLRPPGRAAGAAPRLRPARGARPRSAMARRVLSPAFLRHAAPFLLRALERARGQPVRDRGRARQRHRRARRDQTVTARLRASSRSGGARGAQGAAGEWKRWPMTAEPGSGGFRFVLFGLEAAPPTTSSRRAACARRSGSTWRTSRT